MDWKKTLTKGLLGIATYLVGYLASHPQIITDLLPKNILEATVGSLIAGLLVAGANYLKHRRD